MNFGQLIKSIEEKRGNKEIIYKRGKKQCTVYAADYDDFFTIKNTEPAEIFFENEKAIAIKTKNDIIVVIEFFENHVVSTAEKGLDVDYIKEQLNAGIYSLEEIVLNNEEQMIKRFENTLPSMDSMIDFAED